MEDPCAKRRKTEGCFRVAVTGATGFLGRRLLARLQRDGMACIAVPLRELGDAAALADFLTTHGCGCLVHLAGPLPKGDAESQSSIEETTVELTERFVGAVGMMEKCSFILASTIRMYPLDAGAFNFRIEPKPFDGYGRGKLRADGVARALASEAHPVTVLRISSVCGIHFTEENVAQARGLVPVLVRFAKMNKKITVMGTGEQTKDLIHCEDTVDSVWAAINRPPRCAQQHWRCVFVGTGEPVTVNDCAARVAKKVDAHFLTAHAAEAGCKGEGGVAPSQAEIQKFEIIHAKACANDLAGAVDAEPAAQELGFRAARTLDYMIDEAIREICVDDKRSDRWSTYTTPPFSSEGMK